ncbi:MAG: ice-binding family protein [Solirubrobacteraceae bacterium]|nr:ice-binding family protein [Solirubrobacteraceae bacterium]
MQLFFTRTAGAIPGIGRIGRMAALALALTPLCAATASAGPSPVLLGTAGTYAVLAGSGMTNTGVSTIDGDVGSSPTHSETGFESCPAGNCVSLTGVNHNVADPNDAETVQAKSDLTTAYDDAFGRTGGTAITAPLGGGQTLVSGVYTSATDVFVGGDLTLDAAGDPNAVFIFQARTGTLTTAAGIAGDTPNTRVLLTNGAQACNVFWQVGSSATISTYSQFVGTILADQSITVNTLATLITGRTLARNGAVTLDTNTIRKATCSTPSGEGGGGDDDTTTGGTPAAGGTPTTGGTPATGGTPSGTLTPGLSALLTALVSAPLATAAAPDATPKGSAKIRGPIGAVTGPFTVSVTGRAIAKVVFYVDGKRRTTVRAKTGRTRFSLRINPRRQSRRVHRVTARVTFSTSSRTRGTSVRVLYRRPSAPATPRFTG